MEQETLEEAAEFWDAKQTILEFEKSSNRPFKKAFEQGAKWQAERMYSEEEVKQIIDATLIEHSDFVLADIPEWFEQFKKK
jgi:hypothetical protein